MKKTNDNFCVFILTHGRPDRVFTYSHLLKSGYTGKIYIVIDNEDKTADKYRDKYGDMVIQFDKKAVSETFDECDNFEDRRAIVYARNVCFKLAKELDIKYFLQLDDDYTSFEYRVDNNNNYTYRPIKNFDNIISMFLEYYKSIPALSIAFGQGGDFMGGSQNGKVLQKDYTKRKCMNTFFCSTEKPFKFIGRINEDVNTYTTLATRGALFLTVLNVSISQMSTQTNAGGMTDIYLDNGTYIKSFYSIINCPSSVKIFLMGTTHKRLHHNISWENTTPMIIDEKYKK